jgi:NAD(P)-dependent dehydrogenase (short-subunit alcohol dehydrogenase family)
MIGLLCFVAAVSASPSKSRIRLGAENAALRRQLVVLRCKLKGWARLTSNDGWFFVQLYRSFPSILPVLTPAVIKRIKATTPVGYIAEPKDVAGCSAFLASDGAHYVTGQTLLVDAGRGMT